MKIGRKDKSTRAFVVAVFFGVFVFSAVSSGQGALLSSMIDFFGLKSGQQGTISSAQNMGALAALFLALPLSAWVVKPRLLWISTLCMMALLLPLRTLDSFPVYIGMYALIGLSMGIVDMLSSASISDCCEGAAASRAMCALHGVFGLGGIIAPLFYDFLTARLPDWRGVYTSLPLSVLPLLIALCVIDERRAKTMTAQGKREKFSLPEVGAFLKDRDRAGILAQVFLYSTFFGAMSVWCKRYADVALNDAWAAGRVLSVLWLTVTVCRLVSAFVVRRPARYLKIASVASGALVCAGTLLGTGVTFTVGVGASMLVGGALVPVAISVLGDRFRQNTSVSATLALLMVYLGQTLGPWLMGVLESSCGLTVGMIVLSMLSVISVAPVLFLREKTEQP